jgi:riboflavin synthase
MFTGIIQKVVHVAELLHKEGIVSYALTFEPSLRKNLETGASVSVDGTCQTVTHIEGDLVWFDAINETLDKTTLGKLKKGSSVNIERAAKIGDEIGGHLVSGHVCSRAMIIAINGNIYTLSCPPKWLTFIFPKGFVALNGMSLTACDVDHNKGCFTVHLIPETLKRTTMASKICGDEVNLEVDYIVQSYITHSIRTGEKDVVK